LEGAINIKKEGDSILQTLPVDIDEITKKIEELPDDQLARVMKDNFKKRLDLIKLRVDDVRNKGVDDTIIKLNERLRKAYEYRLSESNINIKLH
jgi:hypothetical protein